MDAARAYAELLAHYRETALLGRAATLLHWDQETMMPRRAAELRAEELAVVETAVHARLTDPRLDEWLAAAGTGDGDGVRAGDLRELRRTVERARRLPSALVAELARTSSQAQAVWVEARRAKRFADFAPILGRLLELKKQEARCLGYQESPYDPLLDGSEPGTRARDVAALFGRLRPRVAALLARITDAGRQPPRLGRGFETAAQLELSRAVAGALGFDFQAGRLDLSAHPFTSGGVPTDVRITTRVSPDHPDECLYSTIHETGHALYEQGIDPARQLTPVGEAVSMGVHESQSRLWENQIGRGRPFLRWLFPRWRAAFPGLAVRDAEELYRAVNRVELGFIRTEADEVTYNLHVILRFELELELLEDRLAVADLEGAWNERMRRDFGREPPDAAQGVLQDIHWSLGAFGYFPSYTLGNVYAAELLDAARSQLEGLDGALERGEFGLLLAWLRERIHRPGRVQPARDLLTAALGHEPSEAPLVAYLERKYGELYDIR